jgi:hypothetical protein
VSIIPSWQTQGCVIRFLRELLGWTISWANCVPRSIPHRVTTALPKIAPLVLKRRTAAFDNDAWIFELKYDGFRALLEIDGGGARLVSRNRNRFRYLDPLRRASLAR